MLTTFISHTFIKRALGAARGRELYSEFQSLLSWDYHYWLHRGALELEAGNLGLAENFLLQSKSIEPADIFIDNELAYLKLKQANLAPLAATSQDLVADAMQTLASIATRRPDQRGRAYHIMGSQGLIWARNSRMSVTERQRSVGKLLSDVRSVGRTDLDQDSRMMMESLESELQRELLSTAVR